MFQSYIQVVPLSAGRCRRRWIRTHWVLQRVLLETKLQPFLVDLLDIVPGRVNVLNEFGAGLEDQDICAFVHDHIAHFSRAIPTDTVR